MSTDGINEDEEMQRALAASMENVEDSIETTSDDINKEEPCSTKKPAYPPLPEEPKGDRNLLCRVGFRLPDGHRLQRNFFRTDPIQVSIFCITYICFIPLPFIYLNLANCVVTMDFLG